MYRSPLLSAFTFTHLPAPLQEVSRPFSVLAEEINARFAAPFAEFLQARAKANDEANPTKAPEGPAQFGPYLVNHPEQWALPDGLRFAYLQTEQALGELLRSKDCAVRVLVGLREASKEAAKV